MKPVTSAANVQVLGVWPTATTKGSVRPPILVNAGQLCAGLHVSVVAFLRVGVVTREVALWRDWVFLALDNGELSRLASLVVASTVEATPQLPDINALLWRSE